MSAETRTSSVVIGLFLVVISWPIATLAPATGPTPSLGLDPSWRASLAMAFVHHLHWGPQIDYTYGPLGFLISPVLYYQSTALLSMAFVVIELWLVISAILHLARRILSLPWAVLSAYVLGITVVDLAPPETILFIFSFMLLVRSIGSNERREIYVAAELGAFAAVGGLIVTSVGIESIAFVAILAATSREWWKSLVAGLAGLSAIAVVLWPLVGGPFSDLPTYLRYTRSLASGYGSALGIGSAASIGKYGLLVGCLAIAATLIVAVRTRFGREFVRLTLATGALLALITYEGFIRDDHAHELRALALLPIVPLIIIAVCRLPRRTLVLVAAAVVASWSGSGTAPAGFLSPIGNVGHIFGEIADVTIPSRAAAGIANNRAYLQAFYAVDPTLIHLIDSGSVAVAPWENQVIWAYDLSRWDPEPTLQGFAAFTDSLDALDAEFLASSVAPQHILETLPVDVDGRYFGWDPPSTQLATVCNYEFTSSVAGWAVLTHRQDLCGPPRRVSSVLMRPGAIYSVPTAGPGKIIVAAFSGIGSSATFQLSSLIWKAPAATVNIQTGGEWGPVRLTAATQSDFHVLKVPYPAGADVQFSFWNITALQLGAVYSSSVRVTFYSLAYHG